MPKPKPLSAPAILPLAALLGLGLALLLTVSARAGTQTVTTTADSGPGSLRQAIADALPGDTIQFALTYPATITLTSGELAITKPLTIAGPGPDLLAVSGNGASRVFRVDAPGGVEQIMVTLSGLTIREGWADVGGGLWNDENLSLADVTFRDNRADQNGGGLHIEQSSPTLASVAFERNAAATYGGGINLDQSSPTLVAVSFSGNSANWGGGLHSYDGSPALTNVSFLTNTAAHGGGGMRSSDSSVLAGVTFRGNSADRGGGMYTSGGSALTDVTFLANSATSIGGGMYIESNSPVLTNVSFRGNATAGSGGGLYNDGWQPALTNVAFSGNQAAHGGGMTNSGSGPRLVNVTFVGNAADLGGAMYNYDSNPYVRNSILWGNHAASAGDQIHNTYESAPSIAYSDVQGSGGSGAAWDAALGIDGGGNLDADPRLVGPVAPAMAPTTAGDLRLQAGPAMDAGINSFLPLGVTTDLAGQPRIVNARVDLGAYELQPGLHLYKTIADPASADMADTASTDAAAWAAPGQAFTYTLTVYNTFGDTALSGGVVSDSLPAGLAFAGPIRLDPPGAGVVGTAPPVLVSDLSLNPGQVARVSLPVTVQNDVALGSILVNTASVTTTQVPTPVLSADTLTVCGLYLTVTADADAGPGSLRQAIARACPGGTVDLALATPATITLTSGELAITRPLTIAGPGPDLLSISGAGASRIFRVEKPGGGPQIAVTITGLTLRDGQAGEGGALWNGEALALANVAVIGNRALSGGGGIYSQSGSATLEDVVFRGNSGAGSGGGMVSRQGNLTLAGVTFESNTATYGGGLEIGGGAATLADIIFRDNLGEYGGGMCSATSSPALAGVLFSDNSADQGGGMYSSSGNPTLVRVTFQGNTATGYYADGGGMYNVESSPVLTDVVFRGNTARYGGGMDNNGGSSLLTNVIFSGNVAEDAGGGMGNQGSSTTLTNVAFSGNSARRGGAMYNWYDSSSSIHNCILWGNRASSGWDQIFNSGSTPSIGHSDVEGSGGSGAGWDDSLGTDAGGNLDADPLFVEPVDPASAPTTAGDLHLRPGSPAINTGSNDLLPPGVTADLDGLPRIGLRIVDLGAYEVQGVGAVHLPLVMKVWEP